MMTRTPRIGVEEEYHLVDPATRRSAAESTAVLADRRSERLTVELKQTMLESRTEPRSDLAAVRAEILRSRQAAIRAAADAELVVAAAGTLPTSDWHDAEPTPGRRYDAIGELGGQVAREALVCACHVHVAVADPDRAIEVCNRLRPWLPVLLALSASSPFWRCEDTGFASYRSIVWGRWPVSGLPPTFTSAAHYDHTLEELVATGVIIDPKQAYWDVRPSAKQPTVEFRIADVCTFVDDAVLQAALARALVVTAEREAVEGHPVPTPAPGILAAARWRAARFGLVDELVDVGGGGRVAAAKAVRQLVDHVSSALADAGDLAVVEELVDAVLTRGTGAERQREVYGQTGDLDDVADHVVAETHGLGLGA